MKNKRIKFKKLTTLFTGRNGTFYCTGLNIDKWDNIIEINPITSQNKIANCRIEIPLEDLKLFIDTLKDLK